MLCLLLACDGGSSPLVAPRGGGSALGRAGEGGTGASGASAAGAASVGTNASGSAPGFGSVDEPRSEGERLGDDGHDTPSRALGGGTGGDAGAGGQGFGGSDTGHGGRDGTGGGAGSDDDDDGPGADGQRRYAGVQSDATRRPTEDCLGASICHVARGDRTRTGH